MLGGELAVLQAPIFDGLSLDPFALFEDGLGPAEVGVGGRRIIEALVVELVVMHVRVRDHRDRGETTAVRAQSCSHVGQHYAISLIAPLR